MLNRLPDPLNPLHGIVGQRAGLQPFQGLFQLRQLARAHNHPIAVLGLQRRVVRHPPVREIGPGAADVVGNRGPLAQHRQVGRLGVHVLVHAAQEVAEAAFARRHLLFRPGQEAAGERAVGVEGDAELAQRREEDGVGLARDRRVVALVGGRQHVVVLLAVVVHGLDFFGPVVGQAEAREVALLVHFVDAREGGGQWHAGVGRVDIEDIDLLRVGTERVSPVGFY
jgi:hypothetical protein